MKALSTLWNGGTNNVDYPYQLGLLATGDAVLLVTSRRLV
ncbi:hypothetical protein SAMN05216274_1322 [Cryobacterium levicorallinum]|uniref:Uncharacterized protein n=1 Tax=Cryobacterium levicorallinum TaxID=995038 RepID=A0ABY1EIP3_9MICO|nr:hypothetical protein SAMN05216274_1322 [Cryobacterium levicorallinum]